MPTLVEQFCKTVQLHAPEFGIELSADAIQKLNDYYSLLSKWNSRLHLVAPCSPEEFATRHVLESLLLLKHLPTGARAVDVGSGAGLPIIPCLLVRDDLQATLVESSQNKAVFMKEALRAVQPASRVAMTVARFEETAAPRADFVTCRALDRFAEMLTVLIEWAPPHATFLFFAGELVRTKLETFALEPLEIEPIPQSERRLLIVARRKRLSA